MIENSKLAKLLAELDEEGESYFQGGVLNNLIDLSLTIATVLASIAASCLAVADHAGLPRWLLPCVAAIPAAAASVQKIVGVRERSNWYFMYAAQVKSLALRLRYAESPDVEQIATERARYQLRMEAAWTKIGSSHKSGKSPHA